MEWPASSLLAARVAQVYGQLSKLAYAQIAPDLTVLQHSPTLPEFLSSTQQPLQIIHQPVTELFWELIGNEEILRSILGGKESGFALNTINRSTPDGRLRYLRLYICPISEVQPANGLLLLIDDITQMGVVQQSLTQERNELRLARAELQQSNERLAQTLQLQDMLFKRSNFIARLESLTQVVSQAMQEIPNTEAIPTLQGTLQQVEQLCYSLKEYAVLGQIGQNKLNLQYQAFDLKDALTLAIARLKQMNAGKVPNISLELREVTLPVVGDSTLITYALKNLMRIPLESTSEIGGIHIYASQNRISCRITCTAENWQLSPDQLKSLAEMHSPLQQFLKQAKLEELWLSSKKIIEAHHGTLEIFTLPTGVTQIVVSLPFLSQDEVF